MADRDDRDNRLGSSARTGIGMLNVLGNLAYAGMRAQGSKDTFARAFSFVVGFPGTMVSYFLVEEGSERAYGVDLPRRRPPSAWFASIWFLVGVGDKDTLIIVCFYDRMSKPQ